MRIIFAGWMLVAFLSVAPVPNEQFGQLIFFPDWMWHWYMRLIVIVWQPVRIDKLLYMYCQSDTIHTL